MLINWNRIDIANNKKIGKTIKPLLSKKSKSREKITLVEDENVVREDESNAELPNLFFSNAIKSRDPRI